LKTAVVVGLYLSEPERIKTLLRSFCNVLAD